jgi:hypothetical protein
MARIDPLLRTLQSRGVQRGVFGASRGWLWVAVASWGIRRLRKANEPELVYRAKLKPGETLQIGNLVQVHQPAEPGRKRGRRRRRR